MRLKRKMRLKRRRRKRFSSERVINISLDREPRGMF
jgi:urease accessory protein UreE